MTSLVRDVSQNESLKFCQETPIMQNIYMYKYIYITDIYIYIYIYIYTPAYNFQFILHKTYLSAYTSPT